MSAQAPLNNDTRRPKVTVRLFGRKPTVLDVLDYANGAGESAIKGRAATERELKGDSAEWLRAGTHGHAFVHTNALLEYSYMGIIPVGRSYRKWKGRVRGAASCEGIKVRGESRRSGRGAFRARLFRGSGHF